jgi:predicted house-cleaning noncanonical NTP pyrophosphatase (MazG superfamily)
LQQQVKQCFDVSKPVSETAMALACGAQPHLTLAIANRDTSLQATVYTHLLAALGRTAAALGARNTSMAAEDFQTLLSEMAGDILTHEDFRTLEVWMLPAFFKDYRTGKFGPDYNRFDSLTICNALREFMANTRNALARAAKEHESAQRDKEHRDFEARMADPDYRKQVDAAREQAMRDNPFLQQVMEKKTALPAVNKEERRKQKQALRAKFEEDLVKFTTVKDLENLANHMPAIFMGLDYDTEQWALQRIQERILKLEKGGHQ